MTISGVPSQPAPAIVQDRVRNQLQGDIQLVECCPKAGPIQKPEPHVDSRTGRFQSKLFT